MSFSNTFSDYVRDIPMEIGRRFYPPPTINLPSLSLPEMLKATQPDQAACAAGTQLLGEVTQMSAPCDYFDRVTHPMSEELTSECYTFDAEKRARQQFDEANREPEPKSELPQKSLANGVASSESLSSSVASLTSDILTPCAAPPTATPSAKPSVAAPKPVSYEEFEGRHTVFDELDWRTIDDKAALSQILQNVSLASRSKTSSVDDSVTESHSKLLNTLASGSNSATFHAMSTIPPYPVLDFEMATLRRFVGHAANGYRFWIDNRVPHDDDIRRVAISWETEYSVLCSFRETKFVKCPFQRSKSEEPTVSLNTTVELNNAVYSKPNKSVPIKEGVTNMPESSLRVRLLTKGYRQNLVNIALERIPRERLPYVEYYMKGMSMLEKRGVEPTKTVGFLLDSNLSEKQAVVQRAQTAEQLVGMGFGAEQVFPALLATQGDRVKALDKLLGSR